MTTEVYDLTGVKSFPFPYPVRYPGQLTLEMRPGGVVPPTEYEVIGYGPAATGVTIRWPNAPGGSSGSQLVITRFTEPERVSQFPDDEGVTARALNAEFDNAYQAIEDFSGAMDARVDSVLDAELPPRLAAQVPPLVDAGLDEKLPPLVAEQAQPFVDEAEAWARQAQHIAIGDAIGDGPLQVPTNEMLGAPPRTVASIADLRALEETDRPVQVLSYYDAHAFNRRGGGLFVWEAGDKTSEVASDPQGGVYVAPNATASGATGCWQRVFEGPVHVSWFGAVGGDQAKDEAGFRGALALSLYVYIDPAPQPYVLDRIGVRDHTVLFGAGDESKVILAPGDKGNTTATSAAAFRVVGRTGVRFRDFYVDGNQDNVTGSNIANIECINFISCTDCKVERVSTVRAVTDGIDWDECTNCYAIDCYAEDNHGFAVHISEGSTDCHTIRCEANNCGNLRGRGAFDVYHTASYSSIRDCISRDSHRGATVQGPNSWVINHTSIRDKNGIRLAAGCRAMGGDIRESIENGLVLHGEGASATGTRVTGGLAAGVVVTADNCSLSSVVSQGNAGTGIAWMLGAVTGHMSGCYAADSANGKNYSVDNDAVIRGSGNVSQGNATVIGDVRLLRKTTGGAVQEGNILSGNDLEFTNTAGGVAAAYNPMGRWMAQGPSAGSGSPEAERVTLYVRVS